MAIGLGAGLALSAGISALGGLLGAGANYATSAEAVKRQIDWERERATHAHQWEVQDLQAAGLNPILSAGGSGATTGGISAPQPDMATGIQQAFGTGLQLAQLQSELAKQGAETQNIGQDTKLKQEQTLEAISRAVLNQANTGLINQKEANEKIEQSLLEYKNQMKKVEFWVNQAKNGTGMIRDLALTFLSGKMGLGKTNTGQGMKSIDLSNAKSIPITPMY